MAVDAEDWCHAVFLHSPKACGPAGVQSCWDPSGQSLGASAPPRGCCTQSISTEFPQHITPYFEACHGCPLNLSITYRIALLTFKATHQFSPAYLTDLLSKYLLSHSLRSCPAGVLSNPTFKVRAFGSLRSFSASLLLRHGSRCW